MSSNRKRRKLNQTARQERANRLAVNLKEGQSVISDFCDVLGIEFKVTNEGHHWQFRPGERSTMAYADWWPSSGQFIPNGNPSETLTIALYRDLMDELEALYPPITGPMPWICRTEVSLWRLILSGALSPAGVTGIMLIVMVIVGTALKNPHVNVGSLSAMVVCGFVLIAVAFSQFVRSLVTRRQRPNTPSECPE